MHSRSPRLRVLVLRISDFAPKGPRQISPGQRPGYGDVHQIVGALKGRNTAAIVSPFQGSRFVRFPLFPRALPWAGMWLPLRGGQIA